jgi:thiamine pyrophosphate-dependent acetolactate synthase large subunit-like protein
VANVSQVVAGTVLENATTVFGLMGNGNAYFLDEVLRSGGEFVSVRHEAAAVSAADTYYRVSGRVAIASVTYGAGFTNILTALTEAAMNHTPLVVITGSAPTPGLRPWDVDQTALAANLGVRTITVGIDTAAASVTRAFEIALDERIPVIVAIPYDMVAVEAQPARELADRFVAPSAVSEVSDLTQVAGMLTAASRPFIVAGQGARFAQVQLHSLADRLGALTATTAVAKGTFAGRDTDLGVCGGFAAPDSASIIADADVVLVVGAGLNQFTMAFGTAFGPGAKIIQVDVAPKPTNARVDVHVPGDASEVLDELLALTPKLMPKLAPPAGDRQWLERARTAQPHRAGDELATDGMLDPSALSVALDEILPAQRLVVQDGGHFSGWAPMFWQVGAPAHFHMVGTAFQSIGLGLASAVGAIAAAAPGETVVLVSGDGGLLMALADLESVARTAASAVIVVFNDSAYGAEVHQYATQGVHEQPMQIGGVDFAALARAVGAQGRIVERLTDLAYLRAWFESGAAGTFLLDCRISPNVVAPYMHEIQTVAARGDIANAERFRNDVDA